MTRRICLAVLLWGALGCGRYGKRVPDELVARLPYETRIELLEAENELAVAIDRVDEGQSEILRTRDSLRRAKSRLSDAEREVGDAKDAGGKEVASLAVAEGEARVAFLRARQELNLSQHALTELMLTCARARYEVARLAVARKAKVEGAEGYRPEEFEGQAKACEADAVERRVALKEPTAAASAAKEEWDKKKDALAKKTFDARASPYVE